MVPLRYCCDVGSASHYAAVGRRQQRWRWKQKGTKRQKYEYSTNVLGHDTPLNDTLVELKPRITMLRPSNP
jgi:hypothetical protein